MKRRIPFDKLFEILRNKNKDYPLSIEESARYLKTQGFDLNGGAVK